MTFKPTLIAAALALVAGSALASKAASAGDLKRELEPEVFNVRH